MDKNRGIGKNNALPWHLKGDLAHFKKLTTSTNNPNKKNAVVMGRKTWESIPEKYRPLPDRLNIVISTKPKLSYSNSVLLLPSLDILIPTIKELTDIEQVFIIGGQSVVEQCIKKAECRFLYLTHINTIFNCDTFFPAFEDKFELIEKTDSFKEKDIPYYFATYKPRN